MILAPEVSIVLEMSLLVATNYTCFALRLLIFSKREMIQSMIIYTKYLEIIFSPFGHFFPAFREQMF